MAISISGLSDAPLFTSLFDNIKITSDDEVVNVFLFVEGTQIFAQSYYTFNNVIVLRNFNSIVEMYMRDNKCICAYAKILLTCDSDDDLAVTQQLIYCEPIMHDQSTVSFISNNFLTGAKSARIPSDGIISLTAVLLKNEKPSVTCLTTYLEDGAILTKSTSNFLGVATDMYYSLTFMKRIADLKPSDNCKILSVTVTLGDRSFTYFIDDSIPTMILAFLNGFNAPEFVSFPALITDKIEVERSVANLGNSYQFYDRQVTKTFETQVKGLSYVEALHLEQLISSWYVGYISVWDNIEDGDLSALPEILITDFSSEPQNGDDELNTLKFTWQFAQSRRQADITTLARIFTSTYSNQYS